LSFWTSWLLIKAGHLVTNLSRDDFEVSENGTLQEIRDFDAPHKIDTIPVTAPKDKSTVKIGVPLL
jgi:hypothetical protein